MPAERPDVPAGGLRLALDWDDVVRIDVPGLGPAFVVLESADQGRAKLRLVGPAEVRFHRAGSLRRSPATG